MEDRPLNYVIGAALFFGMLFLIDWALPEPRWDCHPGIATKTECFIEADGLTRCHPAGIGPLVRLYDGLVGCEPP
jgi:hypothetical protein